MALGHSSDQANSISTKIFNFFIIKSPVMSAQDKKRIQIYKVRDYSVKFLFKENPQCLVDIRVEEHYIFQIF